MNILSCVGNTDFMWDIEEIHDRCFDYLLKYHYDQLAIGEYCHFRTRIRFTAKKEKYWFWGGDDYVAIGFWTGYDSNNNTPNIYFDINKNGRASLFLSAKDNANKAEYLSQIKNRIPGFKQNDDNQWLKDYTTDYEKDYISCLTEFLKFDKNVVDKFLNDSPYQEGLQVVVMGNDKEQADFDDPQKDLGFIRVGDFYRMISGVIKQRNTTPDNFIVESNSPYGSMPLCIKSIEVINYHGIEHLKLSDIPLDAKWIVLTGENGFGKSSVLQSIAIGLVGTRDRSNVFADEKSLIIFEAKGNNERFLNISIDYGLRLNREPFNSKSDQVTAYGTSRLNLIESNSNKSLPSSTANLFGLGNTLFNIEEELIQSNAYDKSRFEMYCNAFLELIPELANIEIYTPDGRPQVRYYEKDEDGRRYKPVLLEQLASGFRNIIAIVGDIILRLSGNDKITELSQLSGIVIIDELELHLHPKYQKTLPGRLSEIFPKVLFIASTHSPIPLLGMPKETVLLRVDRTREKGVRVRRLETLEKQIHELLPNTLLTSAIFNFDYLDDLTEEEFNKLSLEDNYSDIEKNKEIDERLKNIDPNIFPDNLFDEL